MKLLPSMAAAVVTLSFATLATPAQAAKHFNCSTPNGCELVKNKRTWSNLTQTKYPVVMAHGLGGWTNLFGLLEYYNGIPEALMRGGADVFTTKTSGFIDGEVRGEQLYQQIQIIQALTGKQKVNLFGHSHGGSDIRYVAAIDPESVASVTAVSAPAQGSAMADWIIETAETESLKEGYPVGEFNEGTMGAVAFFDFAGQFMDFGSGISIEDIQEQDSLASIFALSTDYMTNEFNVKYPNAMPSEYCGYPPANNVYDGVAYYSFSGVGQMYNILDPADYIMGLTGLTFEGEPNDGLVASCSSRVGHVIRDDYPMNHLDSVNQIFGMVAWGQVEPLTIYRNQVGRLKNLGL